MIREKGSEVKIRVKGGESAALSFAATAGNHKNIIINTSSCQRYVNVPGSPVSSPTESIALSMQIGGWNFFIYSGPICCLMFVLHISVIISIHNI